MLIIPFHVRNFAERVKKELQMQMSTDMENQSLLESWRGCTEVLKLMDDQNIFYELEVIELIKQLLRAAEKLDRNARSRALVETSVQVELDIEMSYIGYLSKANLKRMEVDMLLQAIRNGTEVAVGQRKESSKLIAREFKRIPSEKRWEKLIQSEKVIDLTTNSTGKPLYSCIKVAYEEVTNHPMFNCLPTGMARKYKKLLVEQLGNEGTFDEEVQKAFNILCGIGRVGVYYVYIP